MTLEELLVRIKVENKQAVKGLEEAKKAAEQTGEAFKRVGGEKNVNTSGIKKLSDALKKFGSSVRHFKEMAELNSGLRKLTPAAANLWKELASTSAEIEHLKASMEGLDKSSDLYKKYERDIASLEEYIVMLRKTRDELDRAGALTEFTGPESNVRRIRAYAKEAFGAVPRATQGIFEKSGLSGISTIISGVKKAGSGIKSFAIGAKNDVKSVVGWVVKLGRGFGTVLSKIPLLNRIPRIFRSMRNSMNFGGALKRFLGFASAGYLVYQAISMAKEGFRNLAQYSGRTNADISMLLSSLATLKNALATAFAPILTVVAPMLNTLIQMLIKAATAVAHFTAALTGKSTVVVAKQQNIDYASSFGDVADATGSANDAAKEYKKTLLGFDQMNILNAEDSGSGGSGGGAGGVGGGVGDMFETVEVGSGASSLAERIKEAWKNADFTDLGRDLGNKIAEELNKIPWETLQDTAYKIGKSIATGFNGLNDSKFWGTLGHSVAESLNTVLTSIEGFVFNFDWTKAGKALADGINHLFLDFDWVKLGKTFSRGAKGIFEALKGLFDDIKWEEIGKSVMSAITHVDWVGIIVSGIKAAGSLASGIIKFLKGAFNEAIDALSNWITSGQIWHDLWDLSKATLDLTLNLIGDGVDLIKTVIKGVSKITIELGGAILKKIKSAVEKIANFFGIGKSKKTSVPKNNPVQYQGHDYQGVDMSQFGVANGKIDIDATAKLTSIKDKIPTTKKSVGNMLAMLSRKNETFAKTTGNMTASLGSKWEGFSHTSNNMTASLGSKSEGFSHWTDQMSAWITGKSEGFSHWTDPMSAWLKNKGEYFDHWTNPMSAWLKNKGEYFSHWTDAMTAYITSISLGSRAKQIILNAYGKATGGLYRNGRWQPITAAANGGSFTTGQMFVAREAGPELVGRIGSGTSVMNNDQIVASVSAGVAKGAYEAFVAAFSDTGGMQTNVVLQGDAAKFFRAMQAQAVQYMNSTGMSPFPV